MTAEQFNTYYKALSEDVKKKQTKELLNTSDPIHIITKYVIVRPKRIYMVINIDNLQIEAFEQEMQAVDYCLDRYYDDEEDEQKETVVEEQTNV